ncbi:metal-dependent hydrolase [Marinobacteraceae bacterium S3BR75-40.1]
MTHTPEGLEIKTRNLDFDVEQELKTLWHGGDVFRTAFFNAMSMQFPEGEHQFIRAVRNYRDRIQDPELKQQIKGFIGQEGMHSREHRKYNEALRARGYDIDAMDERFHKHMKWVCDLPADRQLAGTCGAEHYTAVLAHGILTNPEWLEGASPTMKSLWRWHAIEETEHKAVAFDVYERTVRNTRLRQIVFLFVTFNFFKYTFLNTCTMLKAEGKLWSVRTWLSGLNFLWGKPGVIRKSLPAFLSYFRKDFHPWQHDNRKVVEAWKKDFDQGYSHPSNVSA